MEAVDRSRVVSIVAAPAEDGVHVVIATTMNAFVAIIGIKSIDRIISYKIYSTCAY